MSVKVVLGGHASGVFLVTRVSHEFGGLSSVCPVYYIILYIVMSPYSGRHVGMGQCLLQEN